MSSSKGVDFGHLKGLLKFEDASEQHPIWKAYFNTTRDSGCYFTDNEKGVLDLIFLGCNIEIMQESCFNSCLVPPFVKNITPYEQTSKYKVSRD